jgi:hypothetical protein
VTDERIKDEAAKAPKAAETATNETEDQLLAELRAIEDEAARGDVDAWLEQLAAGTLATADEAKLREAAAADPELALLIDVHEPLGSEWKATASDRIAESLKPEKVVLKSHIRALRPTGDRGPSSKALSRLTSRSRLRRRALVWGAPLAAAALFVIIAVGLNTSSGLPNYGIEFSGGVSELRSPDVPRSVTPDSNFEFVLRPASKGEGSVVSRVYVATDQGLKRIALSPETSTTGTIRYRGHVARDLGLIAGEHELVFVVAAHGRLPGDAVVVAAWSRDARGSTRDFQLFKHRLIVEGVP